MIGSKSLLLAFASAGIVAAGLLDASCSSGPAGSAPPAAEGGGPPVLLDPTCTAGGLTIAFNPMYSAYIDTTHTFTLPAVVVGSDQTVTWFADSSMVGMMADPERPNEVLLQTLQPGITTIHVQSADGKCGSAPLTIDPALESDWEIGSARYNDGTSLHLNGPPKADGGSPLESAGVAGPACTNCHGETATHGPYTDVSHTPEQTGGFSDSDLLNIIIHGTFPSNAAFDWSIVAYPVWQTFHQWTDIMPDQQKGIIVYLRSLTPEPQMGQPNFGAFDEDAGMTYVTTGPDGGVEAGEDGQVDAPVEAGPEAGPDATEEPSSEASDGAASEAGDAGDTSETGDDGSD